jgi:hypothetical protein
MLEPGQILVWQRGTGQAPFRLRAPPPRTERRRHTRKYAEGSLPPERSFYFEGPEGKLHLWAQNLIIFNQLAEGVDDATWEYHLRRGDYSRWFRDMIKDPGLADEAARVEQTPDVSPADSRAQIRAAVEKRYTLPAAPSFPIPDTDTVEGRAARAARGS